MIGNNFEFFKRHYFKNPGLFLKKMYHQLFYRKKIVFDYISRQDTVAAYKAADLFLFPSNVECSPIVLFECAAAKLPFLATNVGNSIEIASWTKGGEIMPTEIDNQGFSHADIGKAARMVEELYANKEKRNRMANEAFSIWKQKYSWEVIAKEYEKLYNNLLKS